MARLTRHRKDVKASDFWVLSQLRRAVLRRGIAVYEFELAYSREAYFEPRHLLPRWQRAGYKRYEFVDLVDVEQEYIAISRSLFRRICKKVLRDPMGEVISRLYRLNMLAVMTGQDEPGEYVFDGHEEDWIASALYPGIQYLEDGGQFELGSYIILEARRFEKGFSKADRDLPSRKERRRI